MIIGIPKEIMHSENRVAATPDTVGKLVTDGNLVLVEEGAGLGAYFHDEEYAAQGAEMVKDPAELCRRSDLILPTFTLHILNPTQNCYTTQGVRAYFFVKF